MDAKLAGVVALLLAALLALSVGKAGGWRRVRSATATVSAPGEAPDRPQTSTSTGLDPRGWRVRTVAGVLQLLLVAALGFTPIGARFVHLVAPRGDTWHDAAAWLLILAAVNAVARLPVLWWRRRMRRAAPDLFRPSGTPGQRLTRAALAAGGLLNLVLWIFVLVLEVRGRAGAYPGLSAALVVTTWLLVLVRRIRRRLPPSDRLSGLVSSLPGEPRIPVVSGWRGPVAQIAVVSPWRPVIWVAPPLAAALTEPELRAVLAHEVAHVQHRDIGWRVQRRILLGLCALAGVAALYHIPALRSLAGLHGRLSVQAGPFVLAVWYLVFRILYAMELRAARAEERAADQGMLSLIGDPDACADGIGKVSALLGVPDAWTVPQRLLFATHPATTERLGLLRDPATVAAYVQPRATTRGRAARRSLLAGVLVLGAVVALVEVSAHRVIAMPADAGKYQVLLPRSLDGARLDTTSADAVHLRSSAWGSGYLAHFAGAVPVTAVYDEDGQTWLYVWGAYGRLADPSGEVSAFWHKLNSGPFGALAYPDTEPAGPLGGDLQCDGGSLTCVWADNSGIVVVSVPPPGELGDLAFAYSGPQVTEQQLAAMTRSLRSVAEVPAQPLPAASL